MLWKLARPILFSLPAETAHHLSMGMFDCLLSPKWISDRFRRSSMVASPSLETNLFGLNFQNPVGLAAGFDKDARWFPKLANLGFGHVEVGTITGQAQSGNPKPRLFRLVEDRAIINRMGFNNSGADAAALRLENTAKASPRDILGVNIGKTKVVPVEEATADYLFSFERLYTYADYFTVNVSSPNTPGLRTLQNKEPLVELLSSIQQSNQKLASDHGIAPKPVLLKIAPDVTPEQLDDIVDILNAVELSGIIATNTTLARDGLKTPSQRVQAIGAGGLSGLPLTQRSRSIVAQLYQDLKGSIPIIGVGGIMNGEDAWQMILAGASLVQVYTGFIYGGPTFVRDLNQHILDQLQRRGWDSVQQAVGQGTDER